MNTLLIAEEPYRQSALPGQLRWRKGQQPVYTAHRSTNRRQAVSAPNGPKHPADSDRGAPQSDGPQQSPDQDSFRDFDEVQVSVTRRRFSLRRYAACRQSGHRVAEPVAPTGAG